MLNQEKIISAFEVRRQLGKVLQDVSARRGPYIVEKNGEPVAVVVSIDVYNQFKSRRAALFDRIRASAKKASLSDQEAVELAQEAVEAVRAKRSGV